MLETQQDVLCFQVAWDNVGSKAYCKHKLGMGQDTNLRWIFPWMWAGSWAHRAVSSRLSSLWTSFASKDTEYEMYKVIFLLFWSETALSEILRELAVE